MLFYVEEQAIYLTRGDSAEVSIDLTTEGGENYELGADDTLTLTVRKEPTATSAVIFAKSVTGSGVFTITPEDTRNAEVGQYSADIQLTTADGEVHTVYPRLEGKARYRERNFKNFIIMPEVTIHGE